MKYTSNLKRKWYKTWWGILGAALLFPIWIPIFFMAFATHLILKKRVSLRSAFIGYSILAFVGFIMLANSSPDAANTQVATTKQDVTVSNNEESVTTAPTNTPVAEELAKPASKKITDKINNLVAEKYPNFEVTIWNKNGDFASEGQTPYEVILNGSLNKSIASSCSDAKQLSYYMLETLYKDNEIRPTLSRVMITIPSYLRVSLGASDGVPMAEKGNFSGPTNFWNVMERMGLGENEYEDMKNRTWGTYLGRCE